MQLYTQFKLMLKNLFFLRKTKLHTYQEQLKLLTDKVIFLEKKLANAEALSATEVLGLHNKFKNLLGNLEQLNTETLIEIISRSYGKITHDLAELDVILKYLFDEIRVFQSELNHLTNDGYQHNCIEIICRHTGLNSTWFAGKKVLEAGCGIGRFSLGFLKLGASLVATESTQIGIEYTKKVCANYLSNSTFIHSNLIELPDLVADFDLVWSYDVLHYQANTETYKNFQHLASLVKPNGYIYIMLSPPTANFISTLETQQNLAELNYAINLGNPTEKDTQLIQKTAQQLSMSISTNNELYTHHEINAWLADAGFKNITLVSDEVHHHITAQKE